MALRCERRAARLARSLASIFRSFKAVKDFKEELDTQEIMDDEIKFRYRELENRPVRHRLERLDLAQRLNDDAAQRAREAAAAKRTLAGARPPNL